MQRTKSKLLSILLSLVMLLSLLPTTALAADCYPAESVSDNTATPSAAEDREPTNCTHECSEENGCIKKGRDCQHELSNE